MTPVHPVALQGNLDPNVLFAPPEAVRAQARAVLDSFGAPDPAGQTGVGHVFNLGHGILPKAPIDAVETLVETVQGFRRV